MRNPGRRRLPLPAGLTQPEREFFAELRRLTDVAGVSCRTLEELTSSSKPAADNPCFYSKSQWGRWLNAQSMPPRNAIRRLGEILAAEDIAAEHLLDLWARTFIAASPEEAGQDDTAITRSISARTTNESPARASVASSSPRHAAAPRFPRARIKGAPACAGGTRTAPLRQTREDRREAASKRAPSPVRTAP